ncbi:MAG: SGNH/GDSL hydrolase family protein [bacterium]
MIRHTNHSQPQSGSAFRLSGGPATWLSLLMLTCVTGTAYTVENFPTATGASVVRPLVFVFNGESNSGGKAPNSEATPAELAPRSCVQIMNLTSGRFQFEDLQIGVNNLRDHVRLSGHPSHAWELELANLVAEGKFPGYKQVYLIKTGQGGSTIAQWAEGSAYWNKFIQRIDAAPAQLPPNPQWIIWYSLGINDTGGGTPKATWKPAVIDHLQRMKKKLPGAIILMTQFQSMGYTELSQAIAEIVASEPDVYAIDSTGDTLADKNHWGYQGYKTLTRKMVNVTNQALNKKPAPR